MDFTFLIYFALGTLIFFGAACARKGEWQADCTSRSQTKALQGIMILGVMMHHMAQKTCGPWHPHVYTVHGLDIFLSMGYLFVGVFLFGSGLGLYRSVKTRQDYLKTFVRHRILMMIIAFYLSEIIYTCVRLIMGQKMNALTVLWYLSGLHLANFNAWYMVAIVFLYLVFYLAFRHCKKDGTAIAWVFVFCLAYTLLGCLIGRQDNWWMSGEWWYTSIMLFPMGMLFAKYEKRILERFKLGYLIRLVLSFAGAVFFYFVSEWLSGHGWGYFDDWRNTMKIPHRLVNASAQWMSCLSFMAFLILFTMKIRLHNKALRFLGETTLEIYLMHGMFVEFFGYSFLDMAKSLYIRNLPLYMAVVLGCTIPAALLFRLILRKIAAVIQRRGPGNTISVPEHKGKKTAPPNRRRLNKRIGLGLIALALILSVAIPSLLQRDNSHRQMNGMVFHIPEGFALRYSDSRYAVWEYTGQDIKAGRLVLDADIRDDTAHSFTTAEEVIKKCVFLTEAELYVNPQGVRMARGFADYSEGTERRYYIECPGKSVMLMCMKEDERFYSPQDCEIMLLQIAEEIKPA